MQVDVSIGDGALQGVIVGGAVHFRGIPFAEAGRFEEPRPPPPWTRTRDATRHGPVCPQTPTRIEAVMGPPSPSTQAEACLNLSVVTPGVEGRRPVMVWFHGGAYLSGGGSRDWYRPDALVAEGDVVVVNANYRLGLFGYLRMPGVSPGHLGLLDQIAALRWVQKNIAAFGGDPGQVTVFGESAGGHSIAALMSRPETRSLFHRAILQSAHLGLGFVSARKASRVAEAIQRFLGGADPRRAPVHRLLFAQQAAITRLAGPGAVNSSPPFGPLEDVVAGGVVHDRADLLIGTNRDEMRAFFDPNESIARLRRLPAVGGLAHRALAASVTRRVFTEPARRFADAHARRGASVYLYAFDWAPPDAPFGACHTLDLPFLLGSPDAWRRAPMLGRAPWSQVDDLGRRMRRAWTHFARHGDPNAEGEPGWPKHTPDAVPGRRFV